MDLEEAIRCGVRTVKLLPENHYHSARSLRLLGHLFHTRSHSPHAHADDVTRAIETLFKAMRHSTSPPLERLQASKQYIDLLTEPSDCSITSPHFTVLEAYEYALGLIPQCIWLGNNVRGRYTSEELTLVTEVVSDAVAATIAATEFSRAFEWLETGCSVVWSQILQLRTPTDDLWCAHPHLAEDLDRISQALRRHNAASSTLSAVAGAAKASLDTYTQSSHSYALEYETLIAQIRQVKGFEDFMRPKAISQLSDACVAGLVVVITCTSQDVTH